MESIAYAARGAGWSKELSADLQRLRSQVSALKTRETASGLVLSLVTGILFDTGESILKPGARRALGNVARFMDERPQREIALECITDTAGSDGFNQRLSERRAQVVKRVLAGHGVSAERISVSRS